MSLRCCGVLAGVAALAACVQPATPEGGRSIAAPVAVGANDAGRLAYERACAACHEPGVDGAPVTGRPEDWVGRSRLWEAVLVEHAKRGYFDMPARGGNVELSDREVQAAAEHMLILTHPKLPRG